MTEHPTLKDRILAAYAEGFSGDYKDLAERLDVDARKVQQHLSNLRRDGFEIPYSIHRSNATQFQVNGIRYMKNGAGV